jgi:hypothetical protein
MNMTKRTIGLGARARCSGDFLRSIGAYAGPLGQARGTVIDLKTLCPAVTIATVRWDKPDDVVPQRVNVVNLERCN